VLWIEPSDLCMLYHLATLLTFCFCFCFCFNQSIFHINFMKIFSDIIVPYFALSDGFSRLSCPEHKILCDLNFSLSLLAPCP
jgi:hypothetical protein